MFFICSTDRNIHSTFGYKSLGIEEAAAYLLTAFYFEVTTAVKSRCVIVYLAMRLPGFSHLQFSHLRVPSRTEIDSPAIKQKLPFTI